jgi:hypothetical protein
VSGPVDLDALVRVLRSQYSEEQLAQAVSARSAHGGRHSYAGKPLEYARRVLGITTLTEPVQRMLTALHEAPYRVLMPSAHDVGKTHGAAVAVNYWYDSFDPGVVLTTAPTERDVDDLLWTEIRLQRQRALIPLQDMAPRAAYMGTSPDHYAKGYVSRRNQGFQGRHRERMLFVFDEANDVDSLHWTTTRTMADPSLGCAWLAIFNPTSTTSQAYQEDMRAVAHDGARRWTRIGMSALEHPNIAAQLRGEEKPIPGAVSLEMVNDWVSEWCDPLSPEEEREASDLEWPPGSGHVWRPGPIFQCRALGIWPDVGSGVWSPLVWRACLRVEPQLLPRLYPIQKLPEIGCDCARGRSADYHAIHCRWGPVSFHHETSNTMDAARIFGRLKACAARCAAVANRARNSPTVKPVEAKDVPIKLDDDGTGGAVGDFLRADGYHVYQINAACLPEDAENYHRRRDELWFQVAKKGKAGLVNLSMLPRDTLERLEQQLMAPGFAINGSGRLVVEPKEVTWERIGRSPDDADALNLAYLENVVVPPVVTMGDPIPWQDRLRPRHNGAAAARGLFGRRV